MKPSGSQFPKAFDTDQNLYMVQDALWTTLSVDYYPGASIIIAEGDISKFPSSGIITLVDQCAPAHERAVSFYYGTRTNHEFADLQLISNRDSFKPKKLTKITMQVMADHREALKEAIIAVEAYMGKKHDVSDGPNGDTLFGRINFLRKIIFAPKAWFEADITTGVVPLTVNFKFTGTGNVGPVGDVFYTWTFPDGEIKTLSPTIEKTFLSSGNFDVGLHIENAHGEDTVVFNEMIKVKGQPPEEAQVEFVPQSTQILVNGKLRTPANYPVTMQIPQRMAEDNKKTLAGELVDQATNKVADVITHYDWKLGDQLPHSKAHTTKALYSAGGFYDAVVRTQTKMGSYRTTVIPNAIDVVEPINVWLWEINNRQIKSHEFGLISEVFKTSSGIFNIVADDSFLDNDRQKFEFWRNNGCAGRGQSGVDGTALVFWASGRSPQDTPTNEKINVFEYNGFTDIYTVKPSLTNRPWNWAALVSPKNIYFVLGTTETGPYPTLSVTNQTKHTYDLSTGVLSAESTSYTQYLNDSVNLMKHAGVFDSSFNAPHGHFAAHRTVWKNNTGYLLRNSDLGDGFTFRDFYKTSGVLGQPFQQIVKLPNLPGDWHKEGDLVALEHGIYFFNNDGSTYCFNDTSNVWETVPAHNKVAKNQLDKLLATSDGNSKAYISIEDNAFFKFNEIDMSYITLPNKPVNKQWLMTLF